VRRSQKFASLLTAVLSWSQAAKLRLYHSWHQAGAPRFFDHAERDAPVAAYFHVTQASFSRRWGSSSDAAARPAEETALGEAVVEALSHPDSLSDCAYLCLDRKPVLFSPPKLRKPMGRVQPARC